MQDTSFVKLSVYINAPDRILLNYFHIFKHNVQRYRRRDFFLIEIFSISIFFLLFYLTVKIKSRDIDINRVAYRFYRSGIDYFVGGSYNIS